jgi:hypothetical protein
MAIDSNIKKAIDSYAEKASYDNCDMANTRINKADYDKTLIGFVSEKIVPENPQDDNDYKWRIQTNGVAYDIKPSACNITAIGQRVRLYVPNHSLKDKYAEVIENNQIAKQHPISAVYKENAITKDGKTYDTVSETWEQEETQRVYMIELNSEKQPIAIIFPDKTSMSLEGF